MHQTLIHLHLSCYCGRYWQIIRPHRQLNEKFPEFFAAFIKQAYAGAYLLFHPTKSCSL
jgi:hypothetical protein